MHAQVKNGMRKIVGVKYEEIAGDGKIIKRSTYETLDHVQYSGRADAPEWPRCGVVTDVADFKCSGH